ncbi:hypothetical protein SAMN04489712_10389 [Thermomonospora echinospora]|uniref:Cgl0159-like domain-containing protein n=1 Tax=Thermomonospora echinospora TaxID=1992 RepID=A0A1H5X4V7_9ACTN|nr:aldolase [Thermomonospora echinospora]SEG06794.1 hypothetical protein SAMN04489712_10389 [Thermomonospora echinospora]
MFARRYEELTEIRATRPEEIARAADRRVRRPWPAGVRGRLMIVAADHAARGVLGAGDAPLVMADRRDLLERLCTALERPGVDGVLGTPDVIEDLLLLGALDGKVVLGSMNRGGLAGARFEIDDRFTAYDVPAIRAGGLDGGKMLLRVDDEDPATARTLRACALAVSGLAAHRRMAVVEPFVSRREPGGRLRNVLTCEAMIRAVSVAAGLGGTSAYTWLKVPVVPDMERVMAASTLPALLLGGESGLDSALPAWQKALSLPSVRGLVAGRALLYPPDDDVAAAVDAAVELL